MKCKNILCKSVDFKNCFVLFFFSFVSENFLTLLDGVFLSIGYITFFVFPFKSNSMFAIEHLKNSSECKE